MPTSLIVEADLEMKLQVTDRFQAYEPVNRFKLPSPTPLTVSEVGHFRLSSRASQSRERRRCNRYSFYPSPSPTQNFSGYLECGVSDIIGETQAAYEENYYHVNTSYAGGLATGIYVSTCSSHTDYDTYLYLYAAGDCGGTIIPATTTHTASTIATFPQLSPTTMIMICRQKFTILKSMQKCTALALAGTRRRTARMACKWDARMLVFHIHTCTKPRRHANLASCSLVILRLSLHLCRRHKRAYPR